LLNRSYQPHINLDF